MQNLPRTNYDSRVPVVGDFVCVGIYATYPCRLAEYENFPRNAFLKCLYSVGVKTDSERRIESLLSSPINVQRMVYCQWQS